MLLLLLIVINIQDKLHLFQLSGNKKWKWLGGQNCPGWQAINATTQDFCCLLYGSQPLPQGIVWEHLFNSYSIYFWAFCRQGFFPSPQSHKSLLENEYFNLIFQTMYIISIFIFPLKLPEEFHILEHDYWTSDMKSKQNEMRTVCRHLSVHNNV